MKILDKIVNYTKKDIVPMHMPGHKRQKLNKFLPYDLDLTEIEGFDNLAHPEGVLLDCLKRATKVFGSYKTFYSVNGGSCGCMVAMKTYCNINDTVILSQNCHKSVYNMVELLALKCEYIKTEVDEYNIAKSVSLDAVKEALDKTKNAKCVVITSPTYEGVESDILSISKLCHERNIPLIVDEAHGSHLVLSKNSALCLGADIVLNSVHKTLCGLTQTALIHVGNDALNREEVACNVAKNLNVFQTTSPSYILMSSIDECVDILDRKGDVLYQNFLKNLEFLQKSFEQLKKLKILCYTTEKEYFNFDFSKIVILTQGTNLTGVKLASKLRKRGIEVEMAYQNYVICMSTIFDSKSNFKRLVSALFEIDKETKLKKDTISLMALPMPKIACTISKALQGKKKEMDLKESIGQVSAEYVYAYPPGVPILVPGQKITKEIVEYLNQISNSQTSLKSSSGEIKKKIVYVFD